MNKDYMKGHNKLVATKDKENGIFYVRIDYLANGDNVKFLVESEKEFTVSKKLLYKNNQNLMYSITVENIGDCPINNMIVLYSENSGIFPQCSLSKQNINGCKAPIDELGPGQKETVLFLTWTIKEREEALQLISEVPNNAVYEHKIISVFERLDSKLADDYELFDEGLEYSPYVMKYASESLKKRMKSFAI